MKPFIISLLVCIAAARPLTRRAMINFCLDNWPQGASSCSFPGQLATPLEIKTALLRLEKTRVELFQLMNQLQDHSCTVSVTSYTVTALHCTSVVNIVGIRSVFELAIDVLSNNMNLFVIIIIVILYI